MQDCFETARLRFRPLVEADRELYCALYGDDDTMRHIGPALGVEDASACLKTVLDAEGRSSSPWRIWVMCAADDDCDIGIVGIHRQSDCAEIGAMLLAYVKGRGYAAEAITAIVDMAFRETDLRAVFTRHSRAHRAANRLMETLRFEHRDASGDEVRWSVTKGWWHSTNSRDRATFAIAPAHGLT